MGCGQARLGLDGASGSSEPDRFGREGMVEASPVLGRTFLHRRPTDRMQEGAKEGARLLGAEHHPAEPGYDAWRPFQNLDDAVLAEPGHDQDIHIQELQWSEAVSVEEADPCGLVLESPDPSLEVGRGLGLFLHADEPCSRT